MKSFWGFAGVLLLLAAAAGARADVTCDLLEDKTQGGNLNVRCVCHLYKVSCQDGSVVGWADGEMLSQQGRKITFQGNALDLYGSDDLYADAHVKVGTVQGAPAEAPVAIRGMPGEIHFRPAGCTEEQPLVVFNDTGAIGWTACKSTPDKRVTYPDCSAAMKDPKKDYLKVEKSSAPATVKDLGGGTFLQYLPDSIAVISLNPKKMSAKCRNAKPVKLCVGNVGIFRGLDDKTAAMPGSPVTQDAHVACLATADGKCPDINVCANLEDKTVVLEDYYGPQHPPEGATGKGGSKGGKAQ